MTYPAKCTPHYKPFKAAPLAAAAALTAAALAFTGVPLAQAEPSSNAAQQSGAADLKRQVENLDRAPVAVATDQGVTLGWRML
ncbi:hypothetical protein DBR22_02260, partial [Arthrobacter sp. HMWF013]